MSEPIKPSGPELSRGVELSDVPDGGLLVGQVRGEPVLLVRNKDDVFAVGAACTHYGAPLADGIVVGNTLRCPWHHARFDVRSGDAVGPPALRPLDCWDVERTGTRITVTSKRPAYTPPESVVIVGGGAAGDACADMLRRKGYAGPITLIARDDEPETVDRPNLSKDFLAGSAPPEWVPIRSPEWYAQNRIVMLAKHEVERLVPAERAVVLKGGRSITYGACLLATGATPVRLDLPGAQLPHVLTLRSLADSKAIVARAKGTVAVIGSSFIGLEVAAALRQRNVTVHVIGPGAVPLERVLGRELGAFVKTLHEEKGVTFHLGRKPVSISERAVTLDDGSTVAADLVVMGVGVTPNVALAEGAGLTTDRGVVVDAQLRTSAPGVYAAGDIARFPHGDGTARVEHWAVAQRQGQVVARNMLGAGEPFRAVPFFWSQHYDVPINYCGTGEGWDQVQVAGDVSKRDCTVAYRKQGRIVAVATVYRDRDSLLAEDALGRGDQGALEQLLR
ncbi:MAG: FAD-dependent oxidoreductase [Myxococcaceae bacterium]|nr:FAD-dependent oxidoreductase [Myxococcaceae bacterium]